MIARLLPINRHFLKLTYCMSILWCSSGDDRNVERLSSKLFNFSSESEISQLLKKDALFYNQYMKVLTMFQVKEGKEELERDTAHYV